MSIIHTQFVTEKNIISCLETEYGIKILQLCNMPLGADIHARIYKAIATDQSYYFIKIKQNHSNNIGIELQILFHNLGIEQIIYPLTTKDNQALHHIDSCTLIVYPFISGQNGFQRKLNNREWIIFGNTLQKIHILSIPTSIKNKLHHEDFSSKSRQAVQKILTHLDLHPISSSDEIAKNLIDFIASHKEMIRQLINHAEELAQKVKLLSSNFVLCHADIHAGNILISDDTKLYIVDWDEPIMAPKERDLMFIGAGIAHTWNNPEDEYLFYQGYGTTHINYEILSYYRFERIIKDIAEYCEQLLFNNHNYSTIEKQRMYLEFIAMFTPDDVIDIAFKTYKNHKK